MLNIKLISSTYFRLKRDFRYKNTYLTKFEKYIFSILRL